MSRIIVAEVSLFIPQFTSHGISEVLTHKKVRVTKQAGRASLEECQLWAGKFRSENGLSTLRSNIRLIEETYL